MAELRNRPPLPARPPLLTAEQVAERVVDRLLGFASPEAAAVGHLLIGLDPSSIHLARRYEERLRYLMEHTEDPVRRYRRLTGR